MTAVKERIADRHVLALLSVMLRAGVMHDGTITRSTAGTPQGGVISPLLCNVYLHRLDRCWAARGHGTLIRFADDLVAMCTSQGEAKDALTVLTAVLAELGLEPKLAKTRIVHLCAGGEGLDFLGFHHRWIRARHPRWRHVTYLARWPSRRAMQHARDRLRQITHRSRLMLPVEDIVRDINVFLRGWAGYFRHGNSAAYFDRITAHAIRRLALFVAKRHKRGHGFGHRAVLRRSPNRMGLINLRGYQIAPRPIRG